MRVCVYLSETYYCHFEFQIPFPFSLPGLFFILYLEPYLVSSRKPATQSSEYFHNPAYRAVDGLLATITHTGYNRPAWLQVDLEVTVAIHSVKIYNRLSSVYRLNGASILISKDATIARYSICGVIRSSNFLEGVFYCKIVGHYVHLTLAEGMLHIREMEVYATRLWLCNTYVCSFCVKNFKYSTISSGDKICHRSLNRKPEIFCSFPSVCMFLCVIY